MKAKFSLFILALSLLFFSCGGGLSQEGTGSVTMDAGRVAQHLARSAGIKARDVGSNFDGHGRDMDLASLYSLSMTVKLSTIGDYSASAQEKYKITMEEMAASNDAMESFFKTSLGKPITIEEIPVGSRIKVKAEVSFGQEFDEDAYRKILKDSGMPDAYINEVLEGMKREVSSNMATAEGYSQEFTVKSGSNNVTIRLDGREFFVEESQTDSNHPIILFNGRDTENVLKYQDDQLLPDTIKSYSKGASLFSSISGGESITSPMFTSNTFCFADDCIYMVQDEEIYKINNSNDAPLETGIKSKLQEVPDIQAKIEEENNSYIQIDCIANYDNSLYFPLKIYKSNGSLYAGYFVKWNPSSDEILYYSYPDKYSADRWIALIVTSIDSNEFVIKLQNAG